MLKRSVAIVLMMLYLGTVSGFVLNLHYCFNRLASVNIDAPASACVKVLKSSMMKCCKDKHIDVKVKDAHQNGSLSFWAKSLPLNLPVAALGYFSPLVLAAPCAALARRGPPPAPDIPLFLRNSVFRI
jgi:hypothetical protein